MKKKFLTKALWIVAVIFLVATLFYSEAFAWGGNSHNRNNGRREWSRSYHHDYGRSYDSAFFSFRIGDIVVRLPVEYQAHGAYYERCPKGYIIMPGCGR